MGLTTVNGLPAHPILIHFVVVLVLISALLLMVAVCWPAARVRLGLAPTVVALVTLVLVPITTDAGEWLKEQLPPDPLIDVHAELGEQMLFWSIGVFALAAIWWIIHSKRFTEWRADHPSAQVWKVIVIAVAIVSVLVGAGSMVQVYRIGESGAKAVWSDQIG
ncbi:DUF2231 domain-containing protein [Rhodococcus sp. IEGM 1379]|uniref:DUF2231 domain-containing protein n=1 Tax=Rhodococcus sp. IEGM 1379 TaxID=3047086 RepID=UPI0024B815BC|nr:DUF2231 domain-containing protein [Rhodococcus sp. IEGM 1379]MDI9914480.1 hypothetical protein [Rhodococcus sp. IEGM 1379]